LAYGEFRADQTGLWLHELGLPVEFTDVVATHTEFFKAAQRRIALKALLEKDDNHTLIKLKMLAVCTGGEPRLDDVLEHLLAEMTEEQDAKIRLIQRCELEPFLWERAQRSYGYHSPAPGIRDFAITLFKSAYASGLEESGSLSNDAVVFLKRWKDSVRYQAAYTRLSAECAAVLHIKQDLEARDYRQLIDLDTFELIDRKILSELVRETTNCTVSSETCTRLIRQRRQTVWFDKYAHAYEALEKGAQFLHLLDTLELSPFSVAHGIAQYRQT
jgi:hypothetical protein